MSSQTSGASRKGWYHGWNIVAACVLSQLATLGLPLNAFSLFLNDWSNELNTPISVFQLTQPAFGVITAVLCPIVGIIADKYPARRLFGGAMIAMALFCIAIGSVTAAWQIFVLYGLLLPFAIGFGAAIPSNALVSRWFVRRVGLAMGLTAFGIGMGGVLLPPLIAALLPTVGWRGIWRGAGLVIVAAVLPILLAVLRDRPDANRDGTSYVDETSSDHSKSPREGHGQGGGGLRTGDILRRRNFWLVLGAFLALMAAYQGVLMNLAPIARSHGYGAQAAGGFLAGLSVTHLAATLIMGLVADRFGNRISLMGLGLVAAVGLVTAAFATKFIALAAAFALVGFAGGVWTPLASAVSVEFGAQSFGRAFGLITALSPLGLLSGFAVAKLEEMQGSYAPGLLTFAGLALIAILFALFIRETPIEPIKSGLPCFSP